MDMRRRGAPSSHTTVDRASSSFSLGPDSSHLDSSLIERSFSGDDEPLSRWMGWRLRLLVVAALLGCVGVLLLARWLAEFPHLDATWKSNAQGQLELVSSADPMLTPHEGRALLGVIGGDRFLGFIATSNTLPFFR